MQNIILNITLIMVGLWLVVKLVRFFTTGKYLECTFGDSDNVRFNHYPDL